MALADWSRKVSNALDQALTDHIVLTQSKLSQANPKDTEGWLLVGLLEKINLIYL